MSSAPIDDTSFNWFDREIYPFYSDHTVRYPLFIGTSLETPQFYVGRDNTILMIIVFNVKYLVNVFSLFFKIFPLRDFKCFSISYRDIVLMTRIAFNPFFSLFRLVNILKVWNYHFWRDEETFFFLKK